MKDLVKIVDSRLIFNGSNIVEIVHKGKVYVLRITKEDKLILTK